MGNDGNQEIPGIWRGLSKNEAYPCISQVRIIQKRTKNKISRWDGRWGGTIFRPRFRDQHPWKAFWLEPLLCHMASARDWDTGVANHYHQESFQLWSYSHKRSNSKGAQKSQYITRNIKLKRKKTTGGTKFWTNPNHFPTNLRTRNTRNMST